MKKYLKVLLLLFCFIFIDNVKANSINSVKMNIYVDNQGTAHVTEAWEASLTSGTEGYKPYYNIGKSKFENFKVKMDGQIYETLSYWDISGSFSEKSYKSGINDISNGLELCFGISSYGSHIYVMTYDITNFVLRTTDSDMIYWTLFPYDFSAAPNSVYIKIYSDFAYEDSFDVWGYGNYGGTAYIYDGYIEMQSDGSLSSSEYMTILVKFPKGIFTELENKSDNDFNHYYTQAEEGANHYNSSNNNLISLLFDLIFAAVKILFFGLFVGIIIKAAKSSSNKSGTKALDFGVTGNTLPKNPNMFRELPCGKDLYRAYWLASNYGLMKRKTDFLGAVLLKWLKQQKISISNNKVGFIFKKEETTIVFSGSNAVLDNDLENELYSYMYTASKDGILESREFEKWCKNNYSEILDWFDKILDYENNILLQEGKLVEVETVTFKVFKSKVLNVDSSMYEEATRLKGLKMFFNEFGNMKDKSAIEVALWEEYLMYAQIFGVADKVAKEFKELYPDLITDYSYGSIVFVNSISHSGISSASSARSRAESYSSGGGGFSSGGGGGGSFGGGGGGGGFR